MQPLLDLPGPAANARLTSLGAQAQEQSVSAQCDGISGVNEASNSTVTGCLKPVINYHSLIAVSDTVRRVVAGQLAGGGIVEPEPAGLALERSEDVAARLAGDDTVMVEPTADMPAVAAANVQLILTGETSGLIIDETDTYAGEANLAIQF